MFNLSGKGIVFATKYSIYCDCFCYKNFQFITKNDHFAINIQFIINIYRCCYKNIQFIIKNYHFCYLNVQFISKNDRSIKIKIYLFVHDVKSARDNFSEIFHQKFVILIF